MKQILLVFFLAFSVHFLYGQDSLKTFPRTIGIEYFGELALHPGVKIDYGIPLWINYRLIGKKDNLFYQKISARPNIGYYHLPKYTNNYFIGSDLTIQFRMYNPNKDRHFFFESSFGFRYMRYSYIGSIYQTSPNGGFEERNSGGGNAALISSGFTLGGSLPFNNSEWIIGGMYMLEFPEDKIVIQHPVATIGIRLKLKQ